MKRSVKVLGIILILVMISVGFRFVLTNNKVFGKKGGGEQLHFELPDTIILIEHGNRKVITKEDKLYEDIVNLSDARFKSSMEYYNLSISSSDIYKIEKDEMVIEFIYQSQNSQKTKYIDFNNNTQIREYKRLVMPLSGEYKRMVFFDNKDGNYSSPGVLSAPYDLIKRLFE